MKCLLRLSISLVAFIGLGLAAGTNSSAVLSAGIAQLPPCALQCLTTALKLSPCGVTDLACQCTDVTFISSAEGCVVTSCTVENALHAKNVTQTMCGAPVRDKTVQYNIVSCTLMSLACAFVLVRLVYKKFFTASDLGLDDWFILLALINCAPSAVINVELLTKNGLGKDIWTLTPESITNFATAFWIITMLYFSEVFVLKLSILFFYLRIFPGQTVRRLIWGTIIFDVVFGLTFILTAVLQCRPISYNWTSWRGEGGGQCVNISAIAWANAAVSIALDLWMLAIPLSQLRALKLHWKKKIGVAMMFCVGTFVTIVSIIRLASLVQFRESTNLTWDYWGVSIWSTVEITIGIICACMPSMRLILVRIAPKIFDSTLVQPSRYYYGKKSSATGPNKSADRKTNTESDVSLDDVGAPGGQYASAHVRKSWRVSHTNRSRTNADGTRFSKTSPHGFERIQDQPVPLEELNTKKYGSEIRIEGGANSRSSKPGPGGVPDI